MCYGRGMSTIASRELRNHTRQLLDRVRAGEEVLITVDGIPVARVSPLDDRPRSLQRDVFLDLLARNRADPALAAELDELFPETTDDMPWR